MISSITYTGILTRPFADSEEAVFVPGGYSVRLKDNSEVDFDFLHSEVEIDNNSRRLFTIRQFGFDKKDFPEASFLTVGDFLDNLDRFTDILIDTGDGDDAPVLNGIWEMYVGFANGEVVRIPHDRLTQMLRENIERRLDRCCEGVA